MAKFKDDLKKAKQDGATAKAKPVDTTVLTPAQVQKQKAAAAQFWEKAKKDLLRQANRGETLIRIPLQMPTFYGHSAFTRVLSDEVIRLAALDELPAKEVVTPIAGDAGPNLYLEFDLKDL